MPLMKRASKKAFEHNIKAEMDAGKPQNQSLAIAYSVKRKAKKMARGGEITAKHEPRPMPDNKYNDKAMAMRNDGDKAPKNDHVLDQPTVKQARAKDLKNRILPIKHARMVPSDAFSVRIRGEEDDLPISAKPGPYGEEPMRSMDEEDAITKGPSSKDLKLKMMAEGGKINEKVPMHEAEEDEQEEPKGLESDNDERTMPVDEYMASKFAEGGIAHEEDVQPDDEEHEEHYNSIADAIMAKRNRLKHMESDSDEDRMQLMAEGGVADLSLKHDEEPNNEDKMSFEALKKENYNDSDLDVDDHMDGAMHGDMREEDAENKHDMISAIRSRMKKQRQF